MKSFLPIFCHKTSNSGVYARKLQGNITVCYDSLLHHDCRSVLNNMVVTKCHIQTIMTETNSHGHGVYLIVLIKFSHFALKS